MKRPLAPAAGAENVTSAPGTGFFSASVTVTASRIGNARSRGGGLRGADPGGELGGLAGEVVQGESSPRRRRRAIAMRLPGAVRLPAPRRSLEHGAVAVNEPAPCRSR